MMSAWRCQECRSVMIVENDDDLMFAVLDHPCEPRLTRLRVMLNWLRKHLLVGVNSN